ncbi:hybrid sensor histidine kinase/response regulator [Fulvitalea axinellae]|uniref:histidine kinase n=1 Tax=Fulvitalea axinellae TaxID=1182444 RepID=A0AAU9CBT2_9BACT|nr:hybrid sensor histidine kinase/response regulator [Fulvitalea axinellae]
MRANIFLVFWLIVCQYFPAIAGGGLRNFVNLGVKEGLSQSSVTCISQDSRGYIWVGTQKGLNRYDGYSFETFYANELKENSLPNNHILDIACEPNGDIWISTGRGLCKYSYKSGAFQSVPVIISGKNESVKEIFVSSTGELILLAGGNLLKRKEAGFHIINRKETHPIERVADGGDGSLWAYSNNRIFQLDSKGSVTRKILSSKISGRINDMLMDSRNNLWLAGNSGLFVLRNENQTFDWYRHDESDSSSISNNTVRKITEDNEGRLWVGTFLGLNVTEGNGVFTRHYRSERPGGLSHGSIHALFTDKMGAVWAGTYFGGLSIHHPLNDRYSHFTTSGSGLSFPVVGEIIEDVDSQTLWIGTEGGGVNRAKWRRGDILDFESNKTIDTKRGLRNNNVKALEKDSLGRIWIGTFMGGTHIYSPKTDRLTLLPLSYKNRDATDIVNGGEYMYLSSPNGVWRYRISENSKLLGEQILKHAFSTSLMFDKTRKKLWIGTNGGLYSLLPDTQQTPERALFPNSDLSNNAINCITQGVKDNTIWIGTKKGLNKLDLKKGKFEWIGKTSKYKEIDVFSVKQNVDSILWILTDKFLLRYNTYEKSFEEYSSLNGAPLLEPIENALFITRNETVMIGTRNGLVSFSGKSFQKNSYQAPLHLKTIKVNEVPISEGDTIPGTKTQWHPKNLIELNYPYNNISFGFTCLNYFRPNNNQFEYMLEGYDSKWQKANVTRVASYSQLSAGEYVFKVKAWNNDGLPAKNEISIPIEVYPPFYLSRWAYAFYILIVIIITGLFIRNRLGIIKIKHRLQLETIEKEKSEELHQAKLRFFTNISHEFRTPLTMISGLLDELSQKEKGNRTLEGALRNTRRLRILVDELMDFRRMESGVEEPELANIDFVEFVKRIKTFFESYFSIKGVGLVLETNMEKAEVAVDVRMMEKAFFNLIGNALKYSNPGQHVRIRLNEDNRKLIAKISDSGKGMDKTESHRIFERFYKGDSGGSGIGLALTQKIIQAHNGHIAVTSEVGLGTEFTLIIPMKTVKGEKVTIEPTSEYEAETEFIEPISNEKDESAPIVLIVDDNPEILELVGGVLDSVAVVLKAHNAEMALEIAFEKIPECIICDVMMPGMSGTEFCSKIKNDIRTDHIPVLMLTAKTSEESRYENLSAGADDFVAKPFDSSLLRLKVRNILNTRKKSWIKMRESIKGDAPEPIKQTPQNALMSQLLNMIESQIDGKINVDNLAKEIGVSRAVFYRKLKSITGKTPNALIMEVRMRKAADMITSHPEMELKEIAWQVGVKTPKYFRKCFTDQYGVTPSEYRENLVSNPTKNEIARD